MSGGEDHIVQTPYRDNAKQKEEEGRWPNTDKTYKFWTLTIKLTHSGRCDAPIHDAFKKLCWGCWLLPQLRIGLYLKNVKKENMFIVSQKKVNEQKTIPMLSHDINGALWCRNFKKRSIWNGLKQYLKYIWPKSILILFYPVDSVLTSFYCSYYIFSS